ncbi:MAG: hypothetical protein QOF22_481 [Bradyrhizobium sp.]|nr:hypothetical protein [Bradyrhizobium sp.]
MQHHPCETIQGAPQDKLTEFASHSRTACHDRITRNFPTTSFDYRGHRCGSIDRRSDGGHRHIDTRACRQGGAKAREVSGHTQGRATLRNLLAVRSALLLQSRGWSCYRARLVHGLCEEGGIASELPAALLAPAQHCRGLASLPGRYRRWWRRGLQGCRSQANRVACRTATAGQSARASMAARDHPRCRHAEKRQGETAGPRRGPAPYCERQSHPYWRRKYSQGRAPPSIAYRASADGMYCMETSRILAGSSVRMALLRRHRRRRRRNRSERRNYSVAITAGFPARTPRICTGVWAWLWSSSV